jgi:hypothetical protein
MTISSQVTSVEYVATAAQTVFTGTWRITEDTQVSVYKNGTLLVKDTHYTVSNVGAANFTITLSAGAAENDVIELILDPVFSQAVDYKFNDKFPEETHESALDKLTLICLSLLHKVKRTVRFSDQDPVTVTMPSISSNALKYLRVNAAANGLEWQEVNGGTVPSDANPVDVTPEDPLPGTSDEYSRADHKHHGEAIPAEALDEINNRLSALEGASTPEAASGTFLVSGGEVVWTSGLQFTAAAATYYINGVLYNSAQQNVTLAAADATNPRIDAITLNTTGTLGKVTGTAAASPAEPSVDPATLLKLTIVLVGANAGSPTVTNTSLYAENAGHPNEWNWSTNDVTRVNFASTSLPRTDNNCIEATNMRTVTTATAQKGAGTIDVNAQDKLVLYIRSKGFGSGRWLNAHWQNAGVQKGNKVLIRNGSFGFNSNNTADYQVIVIDTLLFGIPNGDVVDQLVLQPGGGTIGFRIDDMFLQDGGTASGGEPPVVGIPEADADLKYQPIINPNNRSEVFLDFTSNTEAGWFQNCGLLNNKANAPGIAGYINSNNQFGRVPATGAAGVWLPTAGNVAQLEFRGNHGTNGNADHRIGFGTQGTNFPDNDGVYFEHLNADANWFAVCRSGAAQTRTDTGVAWVNQGYLNGSWTKFRIVWTHGTDVKFYINGVLVATISTNIPTQEMWVFFSSTASALNSWWNMDYYWLKFTGLVR